MEYLLKPGTFPRACRKGAVLCLDEADQILRETRYRDVLNEVKAIIGFSASFGGTLGIERFQKKFEKSHVLTDIGMRGVAFDINRVIPQAFGINFDNKST